MEKFDRKIMSSCYINLFFGAGVNGSSFPQLAKFSKTLQFMGSKMSKNGNKSFEEMFGFLNEENKKIARDVFKEEFAEFVSRIDDKNNSIVNLKELFKAIYKLVSISENRIDAMKQINIYTVNYDFITENAIKNLGYLCNYVSASNLKIHDNFFNIVGHDYLMNKKIPTFLVSKIHGDITNPVLPGIDKYNSVLAPNKFEIVFKMKEKLSRDNSILIVIGYSGKDEHINRIFKDCVESGLTIYWFKYMKDDYIPEDIKNKVLAIENEENGDDTTLLCSKMINALWEE